MEVALEDGLPSGLAVVRAEVEPSQPTSCRSIASTRVSDGARTRDLLLSHNPMAPVTVRPGVSGNWACLVGFW